LLKKVCTVKGDSVNIALAKRRIEYLLFVVVTFIPFVFVPIGVYNDFFYAPKVNALILIAFLLLLIALQNRKSINNLIQCDSINITLLIYFMLLIISLFFALDIGMAICGRLYREEGFSTIMIYFLLFLAARTLKMPSHKFNVGIEISATILAIYGIMQFYCLDPFPRDFIRTNWQSAFSTFGNPNFFGTYLVLVIPILLHSFIMEKKNITVFSYSIIIYALLCTNTRGAWIGATVAIIAYIFMHRLFLINYKQDIRRITAILLITFVIIFMFNSLNNNKFAYRFKSIFMDATKILKDEGAEKAGSNRFFIWKNVLILIKDRPLTGYGIENLGEPFVARFKQEMIDLFGKTYYVDKAHNEYLHIAVTTGIPSLIVYCLFITQILCQGLQKARKNCFYSPYIASVLGYLCQAFFNISVVSVVYIFWVFLGFICSYEN
jgi:O-antigen ligase